jgi:hypothetical protein
MKRPIFILSLVALAGATSGGGARSAAPGLEPAAGTRRSVRVAR